MQKNIKTLLKKLLGFSFCTTVIAITSLLNSTAALAEGSRDLVYDDVIQSGDITDTTSTNAENYVKKDTDGNITSAYFSGYRPYLEWYNLTNVGLPRKQVIYVYAKEGETINFGTSVASSSANSINAIFNGLTVDTDTLNGLKTNSLFPSIAVTMPVSQTQAYDLSDASITDLVNGNTTAPSQKDYNDKNIYFFTTGGNSQTAQGYIANPQREFYGVNLDSASEGYTPLSFTAPVTGTYAFRFLSVNSAATSGSYPGKVQTSNTWNQQNTTVAAWDITVSTADGEKKPGRVWTDLLFMNMGNNNIGLYSKVYILTQDGFEYGVNFNGLDPYGFVFFSNTRGFLLQTRNESTGAITSNQPLLHSFWSKLDDANVGEPPDGVLANYKVTDPKKDNTHKIFFNHPLDNDALAVYVDDGKLKTSVKNIADTGDFTYTGIGTSASGPYMTEDKKSVLGVGTLGKGGYFHFYVDKSQASDIQATAYKVKLDFTGQVDDKGVRIENPNPSTDPKNIVTLSDQIVTDSNGNKTATLYWNGKDEYGHDVPIGTYDNIIQTYLESGTVHFPLIDVENNPNGIKIKMLNTDSDGNPLNRTLNADNETYTDTSDWLYYNNDWSSANDSTFISTKGKPWSSSSKQIGNNSSNLTSDNASSNYDNKTNTSATNKYYGAMNYSGKQGDYTALDVWTQYSMEYSTNSNIGVGVAPTPEPNTSKVYTSFVAENGITDKAVPFDQSHVATVTTATNEDNTVTKTKVVLNSYTGKTTVSGQENAVNRLGTNNKGKDTIYGNTISTGFIVTLQPSDTSDTTQYQYVNWTITIPCYNSSDDNMATYVKVPDTNLESDDAGAASQLAVIDGFEDFDLEGDGSSLTSNDNSAEDAAAELSEEDMGVKKYQSTWNIGMYVNTDDKIFTNTNTKVNADWSIYKVLGIGSGNGYSDGNVQINLYDKLSSAVSGEATYTYGIVLDNIYSLDAQATAALTVDGIQDNYDNLTNSDSKDSQIHTVDSSDNYTNNENNPYYIEGQY